MTKERWQLLMSSNETLDLEEVLEGWHFCPEWDGLLINFDMPEWGSQLKCCCGFDATPEWNFVRCNRVIANERMWDDLQRLSPPDFFGGNLLTKG